MTGARHFKHLYAMAFKSEMCFLKNVRRNCHCFSQRKTDKYWRIFRKDGKFYSNVMFYGLIVRLDEWLLRPHSILSPWTDANHSSLLKLPLDTITLEIVHDSFAQNFYWTFNQTSIQSFGTTLTVHAHSNHAHKCVSRTITLFTMLNLQCLVAVLFVAELSCRLLPGKWSSIVVDYIVGNCLL